MGFWFEAVPPSGAFADVMRSLGPTARATFSEIPDLNEDLYVWRHDVGVGRLRVSVDHDGFTTVEAERGCDADDVLLAVALARGLAERSGMSVITDDNHAQIPVVELDRVYDREQSMRGATAAIMNAAYAVQTENVPAYFDGPVREFELGKRTLARLEPDRPGLDTRFFEAMRVLQWPDAAVAALIAGGVDELNVTHTVAVLRPGTRTLLPDVDWVYLRGEDRQRLDRILLNDFSLVAAGFVSPVDEKHTLVEAIPGDLWERLITSPATSPTPPTELRFGVPPHRPVGERWVWVVEREMTYLAYEYDEPGRGRSARGSIVSTPPTAVEVQNAVERPNYTLLIAAGLGESRVLDDAELHALGLPRVPPWR